MIANFGLIFMLGMIIGVLFEKIRIPKIVGLILLGMLLGPSGLNILDNKILGISAELRQIALVIILTRSGLTLDLNSLKKIGRPAILMSFVPATFEIIAVTIFAQMILGLNVFDSLLLGTVLAAVSPAVVVPRMINLIENKKGTKKGVPQLVMAGASVDDIYVIVLFYAFLELLKTNTFDVLSITRIPISIVFGVLVGVVVGLACSVIYRKYKMELVFKVLMLLSISFLLLGIEGSLEKIFPFSALLAIMTTGIVLLTKNKEVADEVSIGYKQLWSVFEILLFVLVGANVELSVALNFGIKPIILILLALMIRMIGVYVCLIKTTLNFKERIFCMISYIPKATVQASIGGIALANGLDCGNIVLTVAVVSILITAPLGATLIDTYSNRLLN